MGTEGKIVTLVICMIFVIALIVITSCISSNNIVMEQCVAKIILDYKDKGILK